MPDHLQNRLIFIAGPTASGKSALAIDLAEKLGGEIINADAMQVYQDLRVVTARPSREEEAAVPHHLYGVIDAAQRCSSGRWSQMAADAIRAVHQGERTAIVVGGTGLYFRALETGLSPIPDIDPHIRIRATARREALGQDAFREEVLSRDPAMSRLPAGDSQRLIRAWEVFEATGKPLSHFHALPPVPLVSKPSSKLVIEPDRATLYERCDRRAAAILSAGGIEEVESLLARGLDPALPVMKALGVPEIARLLRGAMGRDESLADLQQSTRRFAKRQLTWFRNQAADWPRADSAKAALDLCE